jgi:hypothetical protein
MQSSSTKGNPVSLVFDDILTLVAEMAGVNPG